MLVLLIIGLNVLLLSRSPLNEDVFAAPSKDDITVSYEEVKDLQAKIYKLFLQVILHIYFPTAAVCTSFLIIKKVYQTPQ